MPTNDGLHFHERVRVAIGIHGGQVNTADYAHEEPALLAVVHEGDQDASPLLCLSCLLHLRPNVGQNHKHVCIGVQ